VNPPAIPSDAEESLGFVLKVRWYQGIGKIHLVKLFTAEAGLRLEGARFFRVFAESLQEIREPEAGDLVAILTDRAYAMGQTLRPGAVVAGLPLRRGYRPLLQARLELQNAADHAHVDQVLRQLADTEPSIQIEPEPGTGGWLLRAVGELQLDVFCRRLKREHQCDIRVGTPAVHYLEKLRRVMGST
jgi:translation elongation factor EF-G